MNDPTKSEMVELLEKTFPNEDQEDFDWCSEEAMYWFATDYYDGQASNLYSVLSTSPFSPSPLSNGVYPGSLTEEMYETLEKAFVAG